MRKLQLTGTNNLKAIKGELGKSKSINDYKRWQVLYLVTMNKYNAKDISEITGYSKANIYSIVQHYNKSKDKKITIKQRGGRRRELLKIEEEKELMKKLEDKAKKGQIITSADIRKEVERKVRKTVSDDYLWDLFKRNGWTKHSPRPFHPNKNEKEQKEFKKNSRMIWLPLGIALMQN